MSGHGAGYGVGLVFAGLRSTLFCYLWFKSNYIPRALAAWGMLASFLMGACAFSFIIFPELQKVVGVGIYGAPIFFFELTMGFWLLLRDYHLPELRPIEKAGPHRRAPQRDDIGVGSHESGEELT